MNTYKFLRPEFPEIKEYLPLLEDIHKRESFANNGYYAKKLEKHLEDFLQIKHCILVSSGTSALTLAYKTLNLTKKVLVPSFTFISTVSSLVWSGLEPVFVDVDDSLTLEYRDLESKIDEDTEAILAVNAFGQLCDVNLITNVARRYNLKLIFDSASALGAEINNKRIGGNGDLECFSLHATKILPVGEGGFVSTNDDDLATRLKVLRNSGYQDKKVVDIGINTKLSEFHAALGCIGIKSIEKKLNKRRKLTEHYRKNLQNLPIKFQKIHGKGAHQLFPILANDRDELKIHLEKNGIGTRIYYDPLINQTKTYENYEGETPTAEKIHKEILCLPMYSTLNTKDIKHISTMIKKFYGTNKEIRKNKTS